MENKENKIVLFLVICAFAALYWKVFYWLGIRWYIDPDYSHGPLIPLISGYLIWIKRDEIKKIPFTKDIRGIYVLIFSVLLHIFSVRAEVYFTSAYAMILSLAGIVLYFFGKKVFRELSFPIVYLIFMVPFFQFVINPVSNKLKLFSAYLSANVIQILGTSVYREGVMLHFSNGSLEVANPCSGIRSIISLLALGTIFAYFSKMSTIKKIILVSSTVPLAVIGNLMRIVSSGILSERGMDVTTGFTHTAFGMVVFIVALIGLMAVRKVLMWKREENHT